MYRKKDVCMDSKVVEYTDDGHNVIELLLLANYPNGIHNTRRGAGWGGDL